MGAWREPAGFPTQGLSPPRWLSLAQLQQQGQLSSGCTPSQLKLTALLYSLPKLLAESTAGPAESVSVCQWSNQKPGVAGVSQDPGSGEAFLGRWPLSWVLGAGAEQASWDVGTNMFREPLSSSSRDRRLETQARLQRAVQPPPCPGCCWLCWPHSTSLLPGTGPSLFQPAPPAELSPWLASMTFALHIPTAASSAHYEAYGGQLQGSKTVVVGLAGLSPEDCVLCISKALVPGPGLGTWLDTPQGSAQPVSAPLHLNEGRPAGLSLSNPRGPVWSQDGRLELTLVVAHTGWPVGGPTARGWGQLC